MLCVRDTKVSAALGQHQNLFCNAERLDLTTNRSNASSGISELLGILAFLTNLVLRNNHTISLQSGQSCLLHHAGWETAQRAIEAWRQAMRRSGRGSNAYSRDVASGGPRRSSRHPCSSHPKDSFVHNWRLISPLPGRKTRSNKWNTMVG